MIESVPLFHSSVCVCVCVCVCLCVSVSRCGVRSEDDHYRWQTDQTADLGYGNISVVHLSKGGLPHCGSMLHDSEDLSES